MKAKMAPKKWEEKDWLEVSGTRSRKDIWLFSIVAFSFFGQKTIHGLESGLDSAKILDAN